MFFEASRCLVGSHTFRLMLLQTNISQHQWTNDWKFICWL